MFVNVVLLSVGSSVDNFVVGLSLGLRGAACSWRLVATVTVANTLGAFLSSYVGAVAGGAFPVVAGRAAGAVFAYLGWGEFWGWYTDEPSSLTTLAETGVAWRLAVPMTLNNLAGGVAGGLQGIRAMDLGLGALVASYALMDGGYRLGAASQSSVSRMRLFDPRLFAAAAFAFLGVNQLISSV